MAEKTYIVKATVFGHVLNRDVVDKGAMEGRVIPPVVDYVKAGEEVKLDPAADSTKKALASGTIEEPGAEDKRRGEALQAEMAALKARQAELAAQSKATAQA